MNMEVADVATGVVRVTLTGRLDTAATAQMNAEFRAVAETARSIIVDLSGVTFMSSSGIRVLLAGAAAKQRRPDKMVLLSPPPLVGEVLEMTGVPDLVPIVYDEAAALQAIAI